MSKLYRLPGLLVLLFAAYYVGQVHSFVWGTLYHDVLESGRLGLGLPQTSRETLAAILETIILASIARALLAVWEAPRLRLPWSLAFGFAFVGVFFGLFYNFLAPFADTLFLVGGGLVGDAEKLDWTWYNTSLPGHRFDWMALGAASAFMSAMTFLAVVVNRWIERHRDILKVKVIREPRDLGENATAGTGYADELRPSGPTRRATAH